MLMLAMSYAASIRGNNNNLVEVLKEAENMLNQTERNQSVRKLQNYVFV